MTARLSAACTCLLVAVAACASTRPPLVDRRFPPLQQVENRPPIRWPAPPPRPFVGTHALEAIAVELDPSGTTRAIDPAGNGFTARWDDPPEALPLQAFSEVDRGFMRRLGFSRPGTERFVELFRGSPIVSLFHRTWIAQAEPVPLRISLERPVTKMVAFDGDRPVEGPPRALRLVCPSAPKPIVVLCNDAGDAGVIVFFPHRPEIRRWFVEDYRVEASPAVLLVPTSSTSVQIEWEPIRGNKSQGMSFDAPVFIFPFTGSMAEALKSIQIGAPLLSSEPAISADFPEGYWTARLPLDSSGGPHGALHRVKMLRYAPQEMASWMPADKFPYGHRGGFAWGHMTHAMNGVRLDPLSDRALDRDLDFRLSVFFLEAGREKGAPPNLLMFPHWASTFEIPEQIRTVVFCQYWENRLREMRRLIRSPWVRSDEARKISDDLQSARAVFDERGAHSWSSPTPGGGLWFDYFDIKLGGRVDYVINTHATSVANAGALAHLAEEVGDADGFEYWRTIFDRGVVGLLWATGQPWIWNGAGGDDNELLYARRGGGPREYHLYMVEAWLPQVIRLAQALSPSRLPELRALFARLAKARFMTDRPDVQAQLRALREELSIP